jgi:hypothetical protein
MSDDSLFLKDSRRASRSQDAEARDEARAAEARAAEASAHDDRDRPARPKETEPVEHPDLGFDLGNLDPALRPLTPQGPLAFGSTDLPDPTDALSKGLATSRGDDRVAGLLGDLPDLRPGTTPRPPGGLRDPELYAAGTIEPPGRLGGPIKTESVSSTRDDKGNIVTVTEFSQGFLEGTPGEVRSKGTTTVVISPDGTSTTATREVITFPQKDGGTETFVISDDGKTRTEVGLKPDGTPSHTNVTTMETKPDGTTVKETTRRDANGDFVSSKSVTMKDGVVTGSKTVTVDPLGSKTTVEIDRDGRETKTVTDADGKPLAQPSAPGDYPSSGSDTSSGTGTTDDDNDNDNDDDDDDSDDGTPVDDGNSGEAVARIDDESGAHSATFDPSRADLIATTTAGTIVDERTTNTGNPKHQPDQPTDLPPDDGTDPADSPRGDDPAGNTGFGTAPDPSRADTIITTTTAGTVVDERNTNTGNPQHRPDGPTLDPTTLPPDDGTGTDRPTGSGHYTGITPDQTGDGPDLTQGLGIDRGLTVNLGKDPHDLSDLDLDLTGTSDNDQLLATGITTDLDADLGAADDMSHFLDTNWDTPQQQSHIDTTTWNLDLDSDGIPD